MSERSSVDEIQNAIDGFTKGLDTLDKKQYDKVYSLLKDLSLDSDGKIKPTLENLKVIQRVNNQLGSFVDSPMFQEKVLELSTALNTVQQLQTKYYKNVFDDFTQPKTIDKINELSFDSLVDQLTKSGIDENVVNVSSKLVEQHIRDGSSFTTLVDELKAQMIGNDKIPSRLISYSKQIINDTMSGFARNYHAIITDDLDLEWFEYVGALVASSRPMCIVLVAKQYIHKSELPSIARGFVNGFPVSREGFMPNTTGANFIFRCAGYNCEHQCVPVPSIIVPQELRDKFETKQSK